MTTMWFMCASTARPGSGFCAAPAVAPPSATTPPTTTTASATRLIPCLLPREWSTRPYSFSSTESTAENVSGGANEWLPQEPALVRRVGVRRGLCVVHSAYCQCRWERRRLGVARLAVRWVVVSRGIIEPGLWREDETAACTPRHRRPVALHRNHRSGCSSGDSDRPLRHPRGSSGANRSR